jgi:hypothetical protein
LYIFVSCISNPCIRVYLKSFLKIGK